MAPQASMYVVKPWLYGNFATRRTDFPETGFSSSPELGERPGYGAKQGPPLESSLLARRMSLSSQTSTALMAVFFSLGGCLIIGLVWYFCRKVRRRRAEFRELRRQMELAIESHGFSTRCPPQRMDEEAAPTAIALEISRGRSLERASETAKTSTTTQASTQPATLTPPSPAELPPQLASAVTMLNNLPPGSLGEMPHPMKKMVQRKMKEQGMTVEDAQANLAKFGIQIPLDDLRLALGIPSKTQKNSKSSAAGSSTTPPSLQQLTNNMESPAFFQPFPGGSDEEAQQARTSQLKGKSSLQMPTTAGGSEKACCITAEQDCPDTPTPMPRSMPLASHPPTAHDLCSRSVVHSSHDLHASQSSHSEIGHVKAETSEQMIVDEFDVD